MGERTIRVERCQRQEAATHVQQTLRDAHQEQVVRLLRIVDRQRAQNLRDARLDGKRRDVMWTAKNRHKHTKKINNLEIMQTIQPYFRVNYKQFFFA